MQIVSFRTSTCAGAGRRVGRCDRQPLIRAGPENWPLGPNGFWESFTSADVTQHRFFVLLILLFAAFEWGVQTGRLASQSAALVFPLFAVWEEPMLLTHRHAISNIQEAFLVELT
jgi:copper resistance protein D